MRRLTANAPFAIALVLTATAASARHPANSIGIFFDQQGSSHCYFAPRSTRT